MLVNSITAFNIKSYQQRKINTHCKSFNQPQPAMSKCMSSSALMSYRNINFCARQEYVNLDQVFDVRASNYFRRGQFYGTQTEKFQDVINALSLILSKEQKPKILIAGIGDAQEPFSILASVKTLKKDKPLESVLDLHCVDLQPKISEKDLDNYAHLDDIKPMFASDSFDYVEVPTYKKYSHYKVKPDILEYLKEVFDNPLKTKWDTKIEEFAAACPDKTYNMISINNTLGYISEEEAAKSTMENLSRMLKVNGIIITDYYDDYYKRVFDCLKDFKNLAPGIWQKLI